MPIKTIPLSQLEADPKAALNECADSGSTVVVELPDHRLVAIQPLDLNDEDDSLVDDLLRSNPRFRQLVEDAKAAPRKPFVPGSYG